MNENKPPIVEEWWAGISMTQSLRKGMVTLLPDSLMLRK